MPHTNTRSRKPAAAALVILLLACIGLAACGGSSGTSSSSNAAATSAASGASSTATTSSTATSPSTSTSTSTAGVGRGSARFAGMRECLQKNGITLPKRTPGAGPGGGFPGAGAGGGPQLPKGVTRAQYEAALRKCGAHTFNGGAGRRLNNPVFQAALAKYGNCLRQNGVNLPAPNTSGNGPIFNTKGIDTSSPQFRAASAKCRGVLIGAFRRPGTASPQSRGATGSPQTTTGETSG